MSFLVAGCYERVLANYIAAKKIFLMLMVESLDFLVNSMSLSKTLVDEYGAQIAQDKTVASCQEDGDVPIAGVDKYPWCIASLVSH